MQIKYRKAITTLSVLLLISLGATGCSSKALIPATGNDILTTYNNHVNGTDTVAKQERRIRGDRRDLTEYTRYANNELSQSFPRLPNPELNLFVFPHFSKKGHPIPSYSSAFLMYEKDEYALPGELVQ